MKVFGIDLVPLNEPLRNRLEALAAGVWYFLFMGLIPVGAIITIYILVCTKFWPIALGYLIWIWIIDKNVGETGGRPSDWVRSWALFKYVINYFPVSVKAVPGFKLEPTKNYLCCGFPHGYLPIGMVSAFSTFGSKEAREIIPHHTVYGATLSTNFMLPIARDYLLSIGACSASSQSLNRILSYPKGGNLVALFVGGVTESCYCQENQYRLVLKNRKGFVKIALRNGTAIVPVFAFGQNNSFKFVKFAGDSIVQRFLDLLKRITGFGFPTINGRGLYQYKFGFIPLKKPINIVVGNPIEVSKIENPTEEEIDNLHQLFIEKITELFHTYKYEYEENPDECPFVIS